MGVEKARHLHLPEPVVVECPTPDASPAPETLCDTQTCKAVVLAGGPGSVRMPFSNGRHKLGLPYIDGEPLLAQLLESLHANGIREVAVVMSERQDHRRLVEEVVASASTALPRVTCFMDNGLVGTGGALAPLAAWVDQSEMLVLGAHVVLNGNDLRRVIAEHRDREHSVTVLIDRQASRSNGEPEAGGETFSGVYVIAPEVFQYLPADHYLDIKEQLLPELERNGVEVHYMEASEPVVRINSADDYMAWTRDCMTKHAPRPGGNGNGNGNGKSMREVRERVWAGRGVEIAPDAAITGPVTIGAGTKIASGATIVGPTTIGCDVVVGRGATVRASRVWVGCRIGEGATVGDSLLTEHCDVPRGGAIDSAVVVQASHLGRHDLRALCAGHSDRIVLISGHAGLRGAAEVRLRDRVAAMVMRAIDLVVAGGLLLVLSPLFVVIAIAIRLDSKGPIFFRQQRCGLSGKPFMMLKFRSMVDKADRGQQQLADANEIDGPMFKIAFDPRATRVGQLLRAMSLDELPQLLNVLRGEMSMVGPRPLAREEMQFCPQWRDARLTVKPGITGLWQVHGRWSGVFHDWIKYDLQYVRRQSVALNLKTILQTAIIIPVQIVDQLVGLLRKSVKRADPAGASHSQGSD